MTISILCFLNTPYITSKQGSHNLSFRSFDELESFMQRIEIQLFRPNLLQVACLDISHCSFAKI